MHKFKVVVAIFGCVLALAALFVPAFAVDPDYDPDLTVFEPDELKPLQLPGSSVLLGDPVVTTESDPFVNRIFGSKPGFTLYYDGAGTTGLSALASFLYNNSSVVSATGIGYASNGRLYQGTLESPNGTGIRIVVGSTYAYATRLIRVSVDCSDDSLYDSSLSLEQYGFKVYKNDGIGKSLGTQIWSFGDNLLTFVKSHFIVMIPIVIWLFVVALSAIKKIANPEG